MREKIVRMRREMDKFMKDIAGPSADMDKGGMGAFGADVRVDITENDKDVVVKADLPGMSKDQINITLANNRILTISGLREVMTKQTSPGVVRQERMSGRFERSVELPAECENSGIKAAYKEGVLEITLPKKKNAKDDTIKVTVRRA
jgi:HSP20 family protein